MGCVPKDVDMSRATEDQKKNLIGLDRVGGGFKGEIWGGEFYSALRDGGRRGFGGNLFGEGV